MIIDDKFTWQEHINYINNKVSKSLGILYRVKYFLDESALLMLYNSLILPYLDYCCEVWGNTYPSRLYPLIICQKRAIRNVAKSVDNKAHTDPLFYQYKCLKFMDLIEYKSCIIMFKAKNLLLPPTLQKYFIRSCDIHSYSTRNSQKYHQVLVKSKLKSMCISIKGVKLWNDLCTHSSNFEKIISLSEFRSRCKRYYISKYDNNNM